MQKIYNLLGTLGFVMSGAMVVGSLLLYSRIPSLTKYYMSELQLEMTKVLSKMIPAQIDEAMPEMPKLPTQTGPAIKSPF
jgi:hypothetical protein|tara:strand:- start:53 stop:292 length:240 start_codon:yes stop_codon:yes gene_type:complete